METQRPWSGGGIRAKGLFAYEAIEFSAVTRRGEDLSQAGGHRANAFIIPVRLVDVIGCPPFARPGPATLGGD